MMLPERLAPLVVELRGNIRLRIGLWLVLAILGYSLVLVLSDYREQVTSDYHSARSRLVRLEQISRESGWEPRAAEAQVLRKKLENRLWLADTRGLARADVQNWLNRLVQAMRVKNPRIQVEPARELQDYPELWEISVRLDGEFEPASFQRLLLAIARKPGFTVTRRLDVRNTGSRRFSLLIKAYFRTPGARR